MDQGAYIFLSILFGSAIIGFFGLMIVTQLSLSPQHEERIQELEHKVADIEAFVGSK